MTPGMIVLLKLAHDNGGTTRLQNAHQAADFIKCFQSGYLECIYDRAANKYLHHKLTEAGREALIAVL